MQVRRIVLLLALCHAGFAHADNVDDVIHAEMKKRQIPGLSLAVIEGGKIVKVKGYGVTEKGGTSPVTPHTLFQAGSVSKPVAAFGALQLVEKGKVSLDEDVNAKLVSWKVPDNSFTADQKVTLRRLLSHTAGLTVHGFPGYAVGDKLPSVVQVLNGEAPANTAPVRVDIVPGSKVRYSGGGYTVMQLLLADVGGKSFPDYMQQTVLGPLGMRDSSFQQPPPAKRAALAASGYYGDRKAVKGRWYIYPEMAAAGLWTTAADLSRFAIGVQQSLAGAANPVISAKMTREMLTPQKENAGLGLWMNGEGKALQFGHGGRDEGFDTRLVGFAEAGQGAVIMINANDNSGMMDRIMAAISNEYHWPDAKPAPSTAQPQVKVEQAVLDSIAGRYELSNNNMLTLAADKGQLMSLSDGMPDEVFVPIGPLAFRSVAFGRTATFQLDGNGAVTGFVLTGDGRERKVPRIAPLMPLAHKADPEPARTRRVSEAVKAAAAGGAAAAESKLIAAGMKGQAGGRGIKELAGIRSLTYLGEQDLAGRAMERHGSPIGKVLLFKVDNPGGRAYLMIFLDNNGLVADQDLVDN
jgi:CubicO group peptidase (beta-lactamase class C family)